MKLRSDMLTQYSVETALLNTRTSLRNNFLRSKLTLSEIRCSEFGLFKERILLTFLIHKTLGKLQPQADVTCTSFVILKVVVS